MKGTVMADELEAGAGKKQFTYKDYSNWELLPGERYEIIHGEAYAMSAPNEAHQAVSGELFRQLANFFHGKPCKVRAAPYDVRLFYEEDGEDDTVVQPDISVICDENKRGPEGCRGAPDFVLEVLSPSNGAIEMARKFDLYREAGVREYWVADPESMTVLCYVFHADGGISARLYRNGETASAETFDGLEIEIGTVFAELP
jgi:Uma2 family endonuclease